MCWLVPFIVFVACVCICLIIGFLPHGTSTLQRLRKHLAIPRHRAMLAAHVEEKECSSPRMAKTLRIASQWVQVNRFGIEVIQNGYLYICIIVVFIIIDSRIGTFIFFMLGSVLAFLFIFGSVPSKKIVAFWRHVWWLQSRASSVPKVSKCWLKQKRMSFHFCF